MVEYKVVSERDRRFSGSFDVDHLERVLNEDAAAGWRVVSSFSTSYLWKNAKTEIMVIMEREVS